MKYLLVFLFVLPFQLQAQDTLSQDSRFFLLTCSQGTELYNTFGHTAIRILNEQSDIVFNYGIFDFRTENFYLKFLRGKLPYKLGVSKYVNFVGTYRREERSIYQQELDLSFEEKKSIYAFLLENYKEENREYKYDFFFDNCSNRSIDVFRSEIPGLQLPQKIKPVTYRQMLDENLVGKPWSDFGIDLIIGAIADKEPDVYQQCFLPLYLHDHLSNTFIENKPLVKKEELTLDYIAVNEARKNKFSFTPWMLFMGLLVLEILLFILGMKKGLSKFNKYYNKLWFFVMGIAGVLILIMWFGTDHLATKLNWNLLWMHPLYFVLIFAPKNKVFPFSILILLLITLLAWSLIPQQYHIAFIPIIIISFLKVLTEIRVGSKA